MLTASQEAGSPQSTQAPRESLALQIPPPPNTRRRETLPETGHWVGAGGEGHMCTS